VVVTGLDREEKKKRRLTTSPYHHNQEKEKWDDIFCRAVSVSPGRRRRQEIEKKKISGIISTRFEETHRGRKTYVFIHEELRPLDEKGSFRNQEQKPKGGKRGENSESSEKLVGGLVLERT